MVKHGCPLSPIFGFDIDAIESFSESISMGGDGCLLHHTLITILFVDDVILLASSPEEIQRQIDALASFCNLRQLIVNINKIKVTILNC